ncbi:hypothetical protein CR513_36418, partial [Mucuna pruriens]
MVENQSGCNIQVLRSENGKEYTSGEFNSFCKDVGIEHHLSVSYTLQQNGDSERRNRYILEMARCLLHEKNLRKQLWAEAANKQFFFRTCFLKNQTPFEAWYATNKKYCHKQRCAL